MLYCSLLVVDSFDIFDGDKIVESDSSIESYEEVVSNGTVYYAVQDSSNFGIFG